MSELINFVQLAAQAEQDAQDAFNGHTVSNPYPEGSERRPIWQRFFDRKLAELRGQK